MFPFAVGAIAQRAGVKVLMPIVLALLVVDLGLWLALPRQKRKRQGGQEEDAIDDVPVWERKLSGIVRRIIGLAEVRSD